MRKLKEVNQVVIVGGGSSAWITASMLTQDQPSLQVTLIDKEIGTPVGVGEGTLMSFDRMMKRCGFEVEEWFWEVDATFKAGILFPGWGEGRYKDVWHPFLFTEHQELNTTGFNLWSKNQDHDFNESVNVLYETTIKKDMVDPSLMGGYAFHIDAGKLVTYMQKKLLNRHNFTFIKSEVVEVVRDSDTHDIDHLVLANGQRIASDLYVDCTGFNAILSHNQDRVNLDGRLFCDTAIAAHVPYLDKEKEMHPYVISEQVDHGWVWNIPVQSRIGSGLVFNRSQTSVEEAKDYFVNYWDNRITKDKLKVIDWTPYYNKNMWNGNVVAIGLSGGFIEPLESTGLAMIIVGAEQLTFAIGGRFYTEDHIKNFNYLLSGYYEDSIDFVSMHYAKPTKDTKFWNWVKDTFVKSDMQEFYERQIQRTDVPLPIISAGYLFCASNWICWLAQMGYKINPANDGLDAEFSKEVMRTEHLEYEKHHKNVDLVPHTKYLEILRAQCDARNNRP